MSASLLARRLSTLSCAAALALGVAACGHKSSHPTAVQANNNGTYAFAGQVSYQLEVSRELNQFNTEDRQYINGIASGAGSLNPDQLWYGVFLWAKNQTQTPHPTAGSFDIVDTQGNKYYPVSLNAAQNPYAWTSVTLPPGATEPGPDTTANFGPTQGRLLLFKLNTSVYANRPLTLEINVPGQPSPSTISLDL